MFEAHIPRTIVMRNWQTPGMCVAQIRTVDARTCGPVTIRSALIRLAGGAAVMYGVFWVFAPYLNRSLNQAPTASADADHSERSEPGTGRNVTCLLLLLLPASVAFVEAFALFSPSNQNLADRLAGTVVIVDR